MMTAPQQDRQNPPQSIVSQFFVLVYGGIDYPMNADRPSFCSAVNALDRSLDELNRCSGAQEHPVGGSARKLQHLWTRCSKDKGDRARTYRQPPLVRMKKFSTDGAGFPTEQSACEF